MYDLSGKVALVTGARGEHGIGRAIARRLAQEGADIVVNDLPDQVGGAWGGLQAVVSEIEQMGRQAIGITADVSDPKQVDGMVSSALDRFGHLDILVNNAGAPAGPDRVPVVDLEEDVWDLVLNVNAKGTFLCSRAAARHMIERGGRGKIINMSSTAGRRGVARFAAYCASKFAVIGFTQALALELAPYKINVNAICPGLVDTERVLGIADGLKPEGVAAERFRDQMREDAARGNPLGRIGQPGDVAGMAAFLASAESDYLTGVAVNVAGGAVMD